jgi:hypothetical protein
MVWCDIGEGEDAKVATWCRGYGVAGEAGGGGGLYIGGLSHGVHLKDSEP